MEDAKPDPSAGSSGPIKPESPPGRAEAGSEASSPISEPATESSKGSAPQITTPVVASGAPLQKKEPLARSTIEFYVGIFVAFLMYVTPPNYVSVKIFLSTLIAGMLIDMFWNSALTISLRIGIKFIGTLGIVCGLIVAGAIIYRGGSASSDEDSSVWIHSMKFVNRRDTTDVVISLINMGTTTQEVHYWITGAAFTSRQESTPKAPPLPPDGGPLFIPASPTEDGEWDINLHLPGAFKDHWPAIDKGEEFLYCWGVIVYKDATKPEEQNSYKYTFCTFYDYNSGLFKKVSNELSRVNFSPPSSALEKSASPP
jgi:hypothetical protein